MSCPCSNCTMDPCGCVSVPICEPKKIIADYAMPVGSTGIIFVSPLPATIQPLGVPMFKAQDQRIAQWHAASDLADMGLVGGQTLRFLREAIPLTVTEAGALLGVPDATITDWEAEVTPVPRNMWLAVAHEVRSLAQEYGQPMTRLDPPDFRPRVIRVFTPISDYYATGPYPS